MSLMITGVIDGPLTGGVPKAIELTALADIADLSIYGIGSANNGGGTDGEEFTLSGTALAGDKIYVASETTGFEAYFGFAPDFTTSAAAINGDDAVELFENGTVIDVFGDINVDGTGQPWDYLDGWAYATPGRVASVTFDPLEWTYSGPNALDGATTNATAATPFPGATAPVDPPDDPVDPVDPTPSDLIISGVIDGPLSGGLPKAIELTVLAEIADLSVYGIGSANNGGGSDGEEFTLSGSATAGQTIYIASEVDGFTEFFGFAPDFTTSAANINGDDAIELFKDGVVVDLFGDINVDGTGEPWEHLDGWAKRLEGAAPNPVFTLAEWTFSGPNALDGATDNATAATPFPLTAPAPTALFAEGFDYAEESAPAAFTVTDTAGAAAFFAEPTSFDYFGVFDGAGDGGADFGADAAPTGFNGYLNVDDNYLGGSDIDGGNPAIQEPAILTWTGIDISGQTNLKILADLATDDGSGALDPNDFISFEVNVDGAGWTQVMAFETASESEFNLPTFLQDTDFDGVGDGDALTPTFSAFSDVFAVDGTSMDLRVQLRVDSGFEDFGVDNIIIEATDEEPGDGGDDPVLVADTFIHEVQGASASSALVGQTVTIEGIVVGDFQDGSAGTDGDLNGFYVQEEDSDADADALTSEGIFVFDGSAPSVDVAKGDKVLVTGTVTEFFGETQLSNVTVSVVESGRAADATAATVTFPVANTVTNSDGELIADLEAYEGMLVNIPQEMTVGTLFGLGRFGEIGLFGGTEDSVDGILPTYTQVNAPDAAGLAAYEDAAVRSTVFLDDGSTSQNPEFIPFEAAGGPDGTTGNIAGQFDAADELSAGDTISDLTGVVRFGRGSGGSGDEIYRINAVEDVVIENTNAREEAPEDVGGSLKVASLNVLNFFTTLDDGTSFNDFPLTSANQEPRGADDLTGDNVSSFVKPSTQAQTDEFAEFNRQLDKLISQIAGLDADIVGLVELENSDTDEALQFLVDSINASDLTTRTYDYVSTGLVGTDAITTGFIYDITTVVTVGDVAILDDASFTDPNDTGLQRNRPAVAQTFEEIDTGGTFTAAVNHFKSKGSSGLAAGDETNPDSDQGDGAASWNDTRTKAAVELSEWLASDPTGSGDEDFLILGDLNAYAMEDPLQALKAEGYTDLVAANSDGGFDYSFGFPVSLDTSSTVQAFGTLDYALANDSLLGQVTGATEWNTNADEAGILDYNLEFKPQGQADNLYDDSPFRASDHDPIVIGLDLAPDAFIARLEFQDGRWRDTVEYSLEGELIDTQRLRTLSREINVDEAGIVIGADDGLKWSPSFLTTAGKGLGVFSVRGDKFWRAEGKRIDEKETMSFDLEETPGLGDALEVGFEFKKNRGDGQVELSFYDDHALIETVLLDVVDDAVSYDLAGSTAFDRVELGTTGNLSVSLSAVEFLRLEEDTLDFLV